MLGTPLKMALKHWAHMDSLLLLGKTQGRVRVTAARESTERGTSECGS